MTSPRKVELRRILITKFRHHGDVLLTSPLFSILRQRYPDAQIDALVFADTAEMLSLHPAIDQLYTVDKKWKKLGAFGHLAKEWALLKTLRAQRYDAIIHLTESMRGLWIARLAGIPLGVTFRNSARDKLSFWKKTFQYRVPRIPRRHTVESHLDTLRVLGIQPEPEARRLQLIAGEEADQAVDQKLRAQQWQGQPFIVVHPTSRWLFKCWKSSAMAEAINTLCERGHTIVLSASPAESEMAMIADIKSRLTHPVLDLAGQLTLKQLASLIGKAQLLLGVDSVPMHIASAMQTPVVALFGPSGDTEWAPWMTVNRVIVSDRHPCRPCGKDGCGGSKVSDCLQQISVQQVLLAVDSALLEAQG
ncbi:putative lipopolysaccharide heptosyltransferase III [Dickeya fangzhongdai]|uniref:putative lipopolysaccharide heptosyltransferase III n=1 Tax=Dickeya fangzhongdai TaxID=1778540 RepID=UPI0006761049|nr:putative lipopolysaccharide heptosyltransferase III [Dickeya fangzhongdai]MBO8132804.1 putative lipopolysaccharide heptosyltransferase III [Dickeya fangzhongdai]